MELIDQFEQAAAESKNLSQRPDNKEMLKLYSLYKQAKEGDVSTEPPVNPFDFVVKAKYEAWAELKGKSSVDAMTEYIELVKKLKG